MYDDDPKRSTWCYKVPTTENIFTPGAFLMNLTPRSTTVHAAPIRLRRIGDRLSVNENH